LVLGRATSSTQTECIGTEKTKQKQSRFTGMTGHHDSSQKMRKTSTSGSTPLARWQFNVQKDLLQQGNIQGMIIVTTLERAW
jgi:hypothetical protein